MEGGHRCLPLSVCSCLSPLQLSTLLSLSLSHSNFLFLFFYFHSSFVLFYLSLTSFLTFLLLVFLVLFFSHPIFLLYISFPIFIPVFISILLLPSFLPLPGSLFLPSINLYFFLLPLHLFIYFSFLHPPLDALSSLKTSYFSSTRILIYL